MLRHLQGVGRPENMEGESRIPMEAESAALPLSFGEQSVPTLSLPALV